MLIPHVAAHKVGFPCPEPSWSVGPGPYCSWVLIQGLSFSVCEMRESDCELIHSQLWEDHLVF